MFIVSGPQALELTRQYYEQVCIENAELKEQSNHYQTVIADLSKKITRLEKLNNYLTYMNDHHQYNGNRELLQAKKENHKLRKSLRKLYEKYIKPYQNNGIYKVTSSGKPLTIDGIPLVEGDRILYTNRIPTSIAQRPLTPDEMTSLEEGVKENNELWRKLALKNFSNGIS